MCGSGETTDRRWLRSRAGMGERHIESAATKSECPTAQKEARVGVGGFTQAVFAGLVAISCLAVGTAAHSQTLTHIGTTDWPLEAVTGVSGLEVSADGLSFQAISDRGWHMTGQFVRDDDRISEVILMEHMPILGLDGLPVAARRIGDWSDAEGLAIAPDGTIWISFERWAHVSRFPKAGAKAEWIKDHPSFKEYKENRQLEALAIDADGTLFTLPERPLKDGFPIYRLDGSAWTIDGHLPERNSFSIVGADFDANGDLYVLERKLVVGLWWQNRIRRVRLPEPRSDEIIWTGARGEYFNLEGIAVWRDDVGLRITLVSDNNSSKKETTQFVEYRLTDD